MVELISTTALVTAAVTAAVAWLVIRLGPPLKFVDAPDDSMLKVHRTPAIPLGGVAIWSGITVAAIIDESFDPRLFGAATALLVLGLIDDRLGLQPGIRMALEIGVAALYAGSIAGERGTLWMVAASVVIIVAINAVNLYDGLDGLAGGTALVTAAGLTWLSVTGVSSERNSVQLVVALAVFLAFNWHPARLFLGDNGSYLLGFLLAALALEPSSGTIPSVLGRSAVLGVFMVDLASTVLRRRIAHRPLFAGDRSHSYDRLRDRGWSVPRVALLSMTAQAVWVAVWIRLGPDRMSTAVVLLAAGVAATLAVAFSARTATR